jgi:hypothetical protein
MLKYILTFFNIIPYLIRNMTQINYKPLTDVIKKNVILKYPKMDENIVYGQIANYINKINLNKKNIIYNIKNLIFFSV